MALIIAIIVTSLSSELGETLQQCLISLNFYLNEQLCFEISLMSNIQGIP